MLLATIIARSKSVNYKAPRAIIDLLKGDRSPLALPGKALAFNRQYLYLTTVLKPNPEPMKKNIFAAAILLPLLSFSQKVDLDRFKFTTQYRSLPTTGLDTSYHTYNIAIESTKLMRGYLDEMSPASS